MSKFKNYVFVNSFTVYNYIKLKAILTFKKNSSVVYNLENNGRLFKEEDLNKEIEIVNNAKKTFEE